MFQACPRLSERLVTVVALVGANSSVGSNMTDQGEFYCEGFAANMALVRTNASVDTVVPF